jgi:hypothetical protein
MYTKFNVLYEYCRPVLFDSSIKYMDLRSKQTHTTSTKLKSKLIPRMRIASFLEIPENKFIDFVATVESSPIFQKLLSPLDESRRVISFQRFPHAGLYLNTIELFEGATRDSDPGDVESLLVSRSGVADIIRKIGIDNFKKYFLDNKEGASDAEISALCGISGKDVIQVNNLIMDMSIHNEFYVPSKINYAAQLNFHKVAVIEPDGTFSLSSIHPVIPGGNTLLMKVSSSH